jgi:hypothetical protein
MPPPVYAVGLRRKQNWRINTNKSKYTKSVLTEIDLMDIVVADV